MASSTDSPTSDEKPAREKRSDNAKDKSGPPAKGPSSSAIWTKLKGIVWPQWAQEGVRDRRTWKTFARCMVAVLCTAILLVDNDSLRFMGQAGFFGLIVSVMLPPSMALSVFLFAMLTLVVGLCLGWAWGAAAMAAGLRARDQVLLQEQIQTTRSGLDPNANIDAQYQRAIFEGNFLDPRSSTVFGTFLFVGAYGFGFLRAHKPRLTLMCIFGTIIMDVMCSYGPLFPNAQYTLARILLIPAGLYIAIAIGCTIFIFPQSLNHIVTTDLIKTNLKPIQSILKLQDDVLSTKPSETEKVKELAGKARGLRMAHVQGVNALEGQTAMLQLEITRGQIGAGDLIKVFEKAKEVGSRSYGLASFVMLMDESNKTLAKVPEEEASHTNMRVKKHYDTMQRNRHPGTTLEELLPVIATSTAELREAAEKGLDDAITWIDTTNHSRWRKAPSTAADITVRQNNLERLKATLAEFRSTKHFEVLEAYRGLFDDKGDIRPESRDAIRASSPSVFRCHVLTSSLISFSLVLVEFLELLLDIERRNPHARIQLPSAFAKMLMKSANEKSAGGNPLDLSGGSGDGDEGSDAESSTETLVDGKREKPKPTKAYARDPDAQDPTNLFQRFGRKVAWLWKGLSSPEGLFALKYGIVSIALWTPQVCKPSAFFVYENRGLWALIMAQTGLGVFAGEQIASFFIRITGTIVGLVVGMVVWYIGAPGNQSGNPYGVVAALLVFLGPFLLMRIMAPMQSMALWLMTAVTICFVVGYSWVDEHIYQLANQGSGAALAGRRALLVIIGFTAAFIVMLFPRPMSARQIVRQNIAKLIAGTSDLYARVLGGVEEEAEMDREGNDGVLDQKDIAAKVQKIREPLLKLIGRMQSIQMQMAFASAEPGIRGPWPKKKYAALVDAHSNLLSALALLSSSYARLQPVWCRRLERSDHLHPAFVADCLALFSLLHQSLRNGQPMPPTMPIFERLAYHSMKRGNTSGSHSRNASNEPKTKDREAKGQDTSDNRSERESEIIGSLEATEDNRALLLLEGPLTWDTIHDEQLSIFATAVVALTHVANGLNEMQRIIIDLVGVREMGHFERAQERWGRFETSMTV